MKLTSDLPEIIYEDCGKRIFHENETTLKIEEAVHKKFCRKAEGRDFIYMHKDTAHQDTLDSERANDEKDKPILKK